MPRTTRNSLYEAETIRPCELSHSDRELWSQFLSDSGTGPAAFLSFTFVDLASQYFDVRVCRMTLYGVPVAFFPFQYHAPRRRVLGIAERTAGHVNDYFGVVAARDFVIEPTQLLRLAGISSMMFSNLDESQGRFGLTGSTWEIGNQTILEGGAGAFWSSLHQRDKRLFAEILRRRKRVIEQYGPLKFTLREGYSQSKLNALIAEKRAQYRRSGARDSLRSPATRQFLHALAKTSDPECRGTLSSLYAGETWLAFHFGLTSHNVLHYWFPVYNHALRQFGPGSLLLSTIIDEAEEYGITCIDRGAGDSAAKRDFSTSQHRFSRGLWSVPGVNSLVYRAALSLSWRLHIE